MKASLFQQSLLRWYDRARRDLPWRTRCGHPDPYHVLLSEFMLQQTQVATVIPYFHRFLAAFPTLRDLAAAEQQSVLRLWQGLGYYSRARNLHSAARTICERHAGRVPREVAALLELPGVGRYTAGAIASLAYGTQAPIVDGNVQRVLCRVEGILGDPREPALAARLWKLAEALLPPKRIADYNSSLMELGAMVCTPRNPACEGCPVRSQCSAAAQELQGQIPPPREARISPLEERWVFCIQWQGQWLIEQRPASGRWARLWQFPTRPVSGRQPTAAWLRQAMGIEAGEVTELGLFSHALTHRRYRFTAWRLTPREKPRLHDQPHRWVSLEGMDEYPLSKPQQQIARLLAK